MQYLLLIYDDETWRDRLSEEESGAIVRRYQAFSRQGREAGVIVGGARLHPTTAATSVRVRDGERLVTDGPFAETKEQLGGQFLIEVPTLDDALDWAARIPGAEHGTVEVRPLLDVPAEVAG